MNIGCYSPFNPTMRIAFGYRSRVGKDTACDHLVQRYGGTKYSFASPLYTIVYTAQEALGFLKEKDRRALQTTADHYKELYGKDIFAAAMERKLQNTDDCENIFVSDLRYYEELEVLKRNGFIVVKIVGKEDGNHRVHSSETALDDYEGWDYVLTNTGTKEEFLRKVEEMVVGVQV